MHHDTLYSNTFNSHVHVTSFRQVSSILWIFIVIYLSINPSEWFYANIENAQFRHMFEYTSWCEGIRFILTHEYLHEERCQIDIRLAANQSWSFVTGFSGQQDTILVSGGWDLSSAEHMRLKLNPNHKTSLPFTKERKVASGLYAQLPKYIHIPWTLWLGDGGFLPKIAPTLASTRNYVITYPSVRILHSLLSGRVMNHSTND